MLALISHADCLLHDPGPLHPECAGRLHAINNQVIASGLEFAVRRYDAPLARRKQLQRAHDKAHVDLLYKIAPTHGAVLIDEDTVMGPATLSAARRAAGAGIKGVDLIMNGEATAAFCSIRPPGHHAGTNSAGGFCFFNNIAVAAKHAMAAHGIGRVAIIDFDAHHGNGTDDIFRDDGNVLLCSSYQHPFYPHTDPVDTASNVIAVPLPAGTGGTAFRELVSAAWFPALHRFAPEFIFVSAGFDGHILDAMSDLRLTEDDYAWLTVELNSLAVRYGSGRIVSMLEGGYELGALARSVVAHLKALLG